MGCWPFPEKLFAAHGDYERDTVWRGRCIVGHYVLDVQLMFFSALGIVALAGVVVNSSLVLVDYANRQRREGLDAFAAISKAAVVRFRPIILTSVTTFVGLIPLMTTTTPATGPFLPIAISQLGGCCSPR